jgi:hypothetical protein
MLKFKIDSTSERIILTLSELVTVNDPIYQFTFTQVTTKEVVTFTRTTDDDFSNYPDRYNEFEINPSVLFEEVQIGEWHYVVTEQQTANVLEYGKLYLDRAVDFAFTQYDIATTFKTYNG